MKKFLHIFIFLCISCLPFFAHASATDGTIDATYHTARLCASGTCTPGTVVNWKTTNGTAVHIANTGVTGEIFSTDIGWIKLNPTNGGVSVNSVTGVMSGYAFGETASWVNFGPFANSATSPVTVNGSGELNGYAWASGGNGGWIRFSCNSADSDFPNACVKTDWRPSGANPACSNSIDDDGDGLVDFPNDPGCSSAADTDEANVIVSSSPTCSNGVDDDGDGLIDYPNDPGCTDANDGDETNIVTSVYQCSDGFDNDADGFIDFPNDVGCTGPTDNDELDAPPPVYQCSDSLDNDADGLVDFPNDPGCMSASDNSEVDIIGVVYECSDGADNDLDGLTDFPFDPGCSSAVDDLEFNVVPFPECSDGVDNDSDGFTDFPNDPGCSSAADTDETNIVGIVYQCSDSLDNDLDGLTDFPNDPGCIAASDTDETNVIVPVIDTNPTGNGSGIWMQSLAALGLLVGAIASVASILFANPLSLSELIFIPFRLWTLLMVWFGLWKRRPPWGTVYDSVTKQPLDPAYMVLQDLSGKEIATSITDLDGRYGFLAAPGSYRLVANKTNYAFPSTKLAGKTHDELYQDLYFGETIVIEKDGQVITKNIPMDSLNFDWNEFAKRDQKLMKFYSKRSAFWKQVADIFFVVGFSMAFVALLTAPKPYNSIIFGLYIFLLVLRETNLLRHPLGGVLDGATGAPLSFAILRVFYTGSDHELMHKVTTKDGRFYCLLPNGSYYVKIEKKNEDGTYTLVYISPSITITKGHLSEIFSV